jgi:hypothetical protein
MQRIGRIDRRMSADIEAKIIEDHPDQKTLRGEVAYWNFLPPDELDDLLQLFRKVAKKTLRISRVFGIEGRKLLKPDDDYQDLKDFYEEYEGTLTPIEKMRLELQQILKDDPALEDRLRALPKRIFSDLSKGKDQSPLEEAPEIVQFIRCAPDTPRSCILDGPTLSEIRGAVEKHIKNTYLKKVQAPIGVKPELVCWMELA